MLPQEALIEALVKTYTPQQLAKKLLDSEGIIETQSYEAHDLRTEVTHLKMTCNELREIISKLLVK